MRRVASRGVHPDSAILAVPRRGCGERVRSNRLVAGETLERAMAIRHDVEGWFPRGEYEALAFESFRKVCAHHRRSPCTHSTLDIRTPTPTMRGTQPSAMPTEGPSPKVETLSYNCSLEQPWCSREETGLVL
jgi:hypothetical protein